MNAQHRSISINIDAKIFSVSRDECFVERKIQTTFTRMLRRFALHRQIHSGSFKLSSRLLAPSPPTPKGPTPTPKEEDAAMRAREEAFREQFSREFGGTNFGQQSGHQQSTQQSQTANAPPDTPAFQETAAFKSAEQFSKRLHGSATFNLFSWALIVYLLVGIIYIRPKTDMLQGVPWWATSPDMVARWMLHRMVLPTSQQQTLQKEFEAATAQRPHVSFSQYMDERYPNLFQGHRTTQREIVTALAACYAMSGDRNFIQTMKDSIRQSKSVAESVDTLMDKMRATYPNVFA